MSKSITQDMRYRQSLMQYAAKYGCGFHASVPALTFGGEPGIISGRAFVPHRGKGRGLDEVKGMIVLGIDPGYALMGWGVVESRGSAMRLLDYGVVETKAGTPVQDRLRTLQQGIRRLVQQYHPDDVAFEELFFARNVTTALTVGAARGAAIIAAAEYTENLYEYTPMQIKQALTGWGKADKKQIQQMVKFLLHLEAIPRPDDAADGIAAAITHIQAGAAKSQFKMK